MPLLMRDQENREQGMIYGAISMCRDLNFSEEMILKKLQEKFQLTVEEAKDYLKNAE